MDVEMMATNVVWHHSRITRVEREKCLEQRGGTIWLTGLPASGKSTTAFALEYALVKMSCAAYVLDGDNVRHGLNKDLAFSAHDRKENIRRVAEVSRLFADAGLVVVTSFISPYKEERDFVRKLHAESGLYFCEAFIDTPIEVCEARDPKGQYAKARRGELKSFTGVDDPYEPPIAPEVIVKTAENTPEKIVEQILQYLGNSGFLPECALRYEGLQSIWHSVQRI